MKKENGIPEQAQLCIIWDKENYLPALFGHCEKLVFSQESFKITDFTKYDLIYILIEIKWSDCHRSNFHGFHIAKNLRLSEKIKCPIVFCSFVTAFNKVQYPESIILDTPGHYLLQLPSKPSELSYYQCIDDELLNDINMHIFDSMGMLHSLMHDLENSCDAFALTLSDKISLNNQIQELTKTKLNEFNKFILVEKKASFTHLIETILTELQQEILENTDLIKGNRIRQIFDAYKNQIYAMLPLGLSDKEESDFPRKRWSVLFIDDMEST